MTVPLVPLLAASLLGTALGTPPPAPALPARAALGRPHDAEARLALSLVYDGDFAGAEGLLLSTGSFYWAPLVFPLWVLLISVHILLANLRRSKGEPAATVP